MIEQLSFLATIALPLWNIPLILHIQKRKSAKDLSLPWVVGVWACVLLMLPAGLASPDHIFRTYAVINAVLFTGVLVQALRYR